MLQRDIAKLEPPSRRVLTAMRQWLRGSYPKLGGRDVMMFDNESDLVALRPPADNDLLTRLFRDHWPFPSEVCSSSLDDIQTRSDNM